jgi:hypothetical protein
VTFNARLREEAVRAVLSEGLVGVARHHTAQAHLLVAASRDIFKGRADGLATYYPPECVEGKFSEVRVAPVRHPGAYLAEIGCLRVLSRLPHNAVG